MSEFHYALGELVLETREQEDGTVKASTGNGGVIMMTPSNIGGDYWNFRVRLGDKQAIIGFQKFGTIGIGFAEEEDWNSNLPYGDDREDAEKIFDHIKHNKGDNRISDEDCITAIMMIQDAVNKVRDRGEGRNPYKDEQVQDAVNKVRDMGKDLNGGDQDA